MNCIRRRSRVGVATRLGVGGQPGRPRPEGVRKFVVEFSGGPLADLPVGVKPEPILWTSRGNVADAFTEAGTGWRARALPSRI